ncbi:MAG: tetratricopeptide repeat protein [Terracidiphilus sp.]
MRMHSKPVALTMMFLTSLATAWAQAAGPQAAAIDPAVLAKANGGDAAAQMQMGDNSCATGGGVQLSARQLADCNKTAAAWYRKAAEQGSLPGQLRLAAVYRDGKGVQRDMQQAAVWYRKAAEQGDATAQATLGVLYNMGQGVPQSYPDAYYWFDLAARVKGPNQEKYATYRQMSGEHITADELAEVQERVDKWLAAHPR